MSANTHAALRVLLLTSVEEPELPHGFDDPLGLDLGPTDLPAGDPIKQKLMRRRLELGFAARHPEDREDRTDLVKLALDNLANGAKDETGRYVGIVESRIDPDAEDEIAREAKDEQRFDFLAKLSKKRGTPRRDGNPRRLTG